MMLNGVWESKSTGAKGVASMERTIGNKALAITFFV
jgi:hypothetical protein